MPERGREGDRLTDRQTGVISFDPTAITNLLVLSPFYCCPSLDVVSLTCHPIVKHADSLAYTLPIPLALYGFGTLAGPNRNPDQIQVYQTSAHRLMDSGYQWYQRIVGVESEIAGKIGSDIFLCGTKVRLWRGCSCWFRL